MRIYLCDERQMMRDTRDDERRIRAMARDARTTSDDAMMTALFILLARANHADTTA
jgi:hypothetical protein